MVSALALPAARWIHFSHVSALVAIAGLEAAGYSLDPADGMYKKGTSGAVTSQTIDRPDGL